MSSKLACRGNFDTVSCTLTTAMNVLERSILRRILCCSVASVSLTLASIPVSAQFATNGVSGMRGVYRGAAVAGDFDRDGNMDLLFGGDQAVGYFTTIWRNNGDGTFSDFAEFDGTLSSGLAAGDFYNTGQLDLILTGIGGAPSVEFFHNLGNGNFTFVSGSGLLGIQNGFIAVGDFNNDGKLDIVVSGYTNFNSSGIPRTRLCRNLGNGTFAVSSAGLTGYGPLFVGDFDNDGYLDILIGGQLWRNLGNGTFTNVTSGLPGNATAIGDFDNRGYLDVLVGNVVWRNLGNGTFTNVGAGIIGTGVSVGDYDNDGNLDILSNYITNNTAFVQVWRNLGNGNFLNSFTISNAPGLGSMLWGDFNNDGQLDFFVTGQQAQDQNGDPICVAQIWQNTLTGSNSPPTAPTNLTSHLIGGSGVRLNWGAATDDHTPASGLNYNIRVGSSPGALDIVSPMADPVTGKRLVVQIGNAQTRLFSILTNLTGGTYYWSVQAIDTAFAGGAFATESTFVIPPSISGWAYQTNGQFQVNFNALAGSSYTLQASSNLVQWTFVANVIPGVTGPAQLTDTNASSFPTRYYRLSCP